jgi:hypothetical protein
MRRLAMAVILLVLAGAASDVEAGGGGHRSGGHSGSHHGGHHHGGRGTVILGFGPWWGPWWGGWGWPGWYDPYYTYAPPVVVTEPPVYVERQGQAEPAAGYWHYCASAAGYYPDVQSCPEPWVKVPPTNP